jgi:KDO2-lipid IV(A) lauroyltransferase
MTRRRRRTQRAQAVRWRLEAAGVRAGVRILDGLPEPAALRIGAVAGRFAGRLWLRYRRIALANMRAAFPDWSAARREELLASHLRRLGCTAAEWARLPSLAGGALLERVEFEGLPELEKAFSRGRGVLVASAHYGFWELILPALRQRLGNSRLTAVGRAQRNPHLRALVDERRRLGDGAAPLPQDARAILRTLRGNAGVGLLADHYLSPRRGGLLSPFLGRRAWTNPGPAILALHSGSALLLGHTRPLASGRHLVTLGPEIAPPQTGDRSRDIAIMTEALNAAIGGWIRQRPEPWLWLHARFRGSPDVDSDAYERAAQRRRSLGRGARREMRARLDDR